MARPKFIDDLAGVAGGAFSALSGIGEEVEQLVRARVDEALRGLRLVRRDEFDAVSELAANARAAQEDAETRLVALEGRVAALESRVSKSSASRSDSDSGTRPAAAGESRPAAEPPHLEAEGGLGGPPDGESGGTV